MDKRGGKGSKAERIKLRKKLVSNEILFESSQVDHVPSDSNIMNEAPAKEVTEKKRHKLSGKKRKGDNVRGADIDKVDQLGSHGEDASKSVKHKSGRASKKKKKDRALSENVSRAIDEENEPPASEVYQISSVDVDSSQGMKKWINEYYQRRPGLKILQERIDELITSHEKQEEDARKAREELIGEDGWTVVVHHKGRKKTTDAESGTAVGSVAQAAVMDKLGKKKSKDVGLNFYRFQKREGQRNEIMMLQSKFEQDKKRIQQLRAARKFRPY